MFCKSFIVSGYKEVYKKVECRLPRIVSAPRHKAAQSGIEYLEGVGTASYQAQERQQEECNNYQELAW
ncbi:MAG: hypothetical protein LUE98_11250 [Tannerellaceae bacterium]|nr:hypothetical protein [Tannerellaceae bacterium]